MKRPLRIILGIVGALVALVVMLQLFGMWVLSHKEFAFEDRDLPRHLSGRWDWSTHRNRCGDSAHVIAISANHKTMTISMPPHLADTGYTATYDLLELKPSRLRGAIRGEKRLTDTGAPVVWDLVMFGANEYRWQRTDWAPWSYTAAITRCDGSAEDTT